MKLTIDIEKELIETAKREIDEFYLEALAKAQEKAENDIDRIARKIILKVRLALKDVEIMKHKEG